MKKTNKLIDLINSDLPEPCSEEEKRIIEEWLSANAAEVDEVLLDDENAMKKIENEIFTKVDERINKKEQLSNKRNNFSFLRIAASIALCITFGLLFYYLIGNDKHNYLTVATSKGETMELMLPDSSTVWLNGGSTIKYPPEFGDTRDVQLISGEVFFDVKRNEQSPFRVFTPELTVTVLGTSFNVKSYEDLEDTRITVVSGKVQVGNDSDIFGKFTKNNELIFHKKSGEHKTRNVESGKIIKWRQGEINLYEVPFHEMIVAMENTYGINIHYDTVPFANCKITVSFHASDQLAQVLDVIKAIYGLTYEIKEGKEVILQIDQRTQLCQ